jgi:hypothetical protein
MQKKLIVVGVLSLIIGLAGGYFGGQALAPKRAGIGARGGANGQFRQTTNGQRNSIGQILSISSDRLTLKTRDGSSQIILLTSDTTYAKSVSASQGDFQTGASVVINGQSNPDGSVTATSVQTAPTNLGQVQQPANPSGTPINPNAGSPISN